MLHVNYISKLGESNRLFNNLTFTEGKKEYINYTESEVSLMIKCTILFHHEETHQKNAPNETIMSHRL